MRQFLGSCSLLAVALALFALSGAAQTLALVGGTAYVNPDAGALNDAVILIDNGRISQIGPAGAITVPEGATVLDCTGATITAGFWNSHVHFTAPEWERASAAPAGRLSQQLDDMLTRYGFTSVFDTGSDFANTSALRARIESGEVNGPRILTVGPALVAKDGVPYYLRPAALPELLNVNQARDLVRGLLDQGVDGIKLHAGAIVNRETNEHRFIPVALVQAVAEEAHARGKLVFAHPQYIDGVMAAIEGGADVLTHVTAETDRWQRDLMTIALRRGVSLIPTLKLLAGTEPSQKQRNLLWQAGEWAQAGGSVLFGTDAGYLDDFDPADEYVLLQQAGLNWREILKALTTEPARRFSGGGAEETLIRGNSADLVVLNGDPAKDVKAFADVRWTIRAGRLIFARAADSAVR